MPLRKPHRFGAFASAFLSLALPAVFAANGGCELTVPDTVPAFSCVPGPDSCPTDAVCAPATGKCIPRSQACAPGSCPPGSTCDMSTLACASTALDASVASCRSLGCNCSGPLDCASGICGQAVTVTTNVYKAANSTSFCTKPCCTSADCDASTVCFGTAAGGSYCVRPEWLGRATTLGIQPGGAACSGDSDCRSGLCAGTWCADTCCSTAQSATECAPGTTCAFGAFPGKSFDVHDTAYCAPASGTGANGSACASASQCLGALCTGGQCHDACRSSADCGSPTQECGYAILLTLEIVTACSSSLGTGAEGSSCQSNNGCQSGFCDSTSMQCTDVCYADTDCQAGTADGWRCRPEVMALPGGASYSVLACGS